MASGSSSRREAETAGTGWKYTSEFSLSALVSRALTRATANETPPDKWFIALPLIVPPRVCKI